MIISLVYVSIVYMLATCFQHIGKGLCVIIMVMQIPGSAGLYPIEMLPSFFRSCTRCSPSPTALMRCVKSSGDSTGTPTSHAWRFSAPRRWLPSRLAWRCARSW